MNTKIIPSNTTHIPGNLTNNEVVSPTVAIIRGAAGTVLMTDAHQPHKTVPFIESHRSLTTGEKWPQLVNEGLISTVKRKGKSVLGKPPHITHPENITIDPSIPEATLTSLEKGSPSDIYGFLYHLRHQLTKVDMFQKQHGHAEGNWRDGYDEITHLDVGQNKRGEKAGWYWMTLDNQICINKGILDIMSTLFDTCESLQDIDNPFSQITIPHQEFTDLQGQYETFLLLIGGMDQVLTNFQPYVSLENEVFEKTLFYINGNDSPTILRGERRFLPELSIEAREILKNTGIKGLKDLCHILVSNIDVKRNINGLRRAPSRVDEVEAQNMALENFKRTLLKGISATGMQNEELSRIILNGKAVDERYTDLDGSYGEYGEVLKALDRYFSSESTAI